MFNEPLYNGSRDLHYSFGIIATLLIPSNGIPLSFCQQIYFVCRRSVATENEVLPVHESAAEGRGAGGQQLVVFLFFGGVPGHERGKGRGCRIQCKAATAQQRHNPTHSHAGP